MFSVDYPFGSCVDAAIWFDAAAISEPDRVKVGRTNALRLFRLAVSRLSCSGITQMPNSLVAVIFSRPGAVDPNTTGVGPFNAGSHT